MSAILLAAAASDLGRAAAIEVIKDLRVRGPYSRLWLTLSAAGKRAPSPEESRRRLREAIELETLQQLPSTPQIASGEGD